MIGRHILIPITSVIIAKRLCGQENYIICLDVNVYISEPDANYIAKDLTLLPSCAGHHC